MHQKGQFHLKNMKSFPAILQDSFSLSSWAAEGGFWRFFSVDCTVTRQREAVAQRAALITCSHIRFCLYLDVFTSGRRAQRLLPDFWD